MLQNEGGGFKKVKGEKSMSHLLFVMKQDIIYCRIIEHLKVDWTHKCGPLFCLHYIYSTRCYSLWSFG